MTLDKIKHLLHDEVYKILKLEGIKKLRPSQRKSIDAGLFEDKNLVVCTPTASGKTLVAELAAMHHVLKKGGMTIYIVPLKALAYEKYRDFRRKYEKLAKVSMSVGNMDEKEEYLGSVDILITTSEKMDSLIRHKIKWLNKISLIVIDEIHLLNDVTRGPTLEVLITMMKTLLPKAQIIGLSATIKNAKELAQWLNANLVKDDWRPVELKKGVYLNGEVEFFEE